MIVELLDEEIGLVLLAEQRGDLGASFRSSDGGGDSPETRSLADSETPLRRLLNPRLVTARRLYKHDFREDVSGGVCDAFERCLETHDVASQDAPAALALIGSDGEVNDTGLLDRDDEYSKAAGRCMRQSLAEVELPPPPGDQSLYLRCQTDFPHIIRGDQTYPEDGSVDAPADILFDEYEHNSAYHKKRLRKVFE